MEDLKKIYPLALSHLVGNVLTNISLRQVAVSFTHTIKAAEPFFSVIGVFLSVNSMKCANASRLHYPNSLFQERCILFGYTFL
jgi:hypothetical protein